MAEKSLYERLGGIFAIAAVVNDFSDNIIQNPKVGAMSPNPNLKEWSTEEIAARMPGLKWMRTLWVCDVSGGPFEFVATHPGHDHLALEKAHERFKISPEEFDAVANELAKSLDRFNVPSREKYEVLNAFAAHKSEVNEGFFKGKEMAA